MRILHSDVWMRRGGGGDDGNVTAGLFHRREMENRGHAAGHMLILAHCGPPRAPKEKHPTLFSNLNTNFTMWGGCVKSEKGRSYVLPELTHCLIHGGHGLAFHYHTPQEKSTSKPKYCLILSWSCSIWCYSRICVCVCKCCFGNASY